MIQPIEFFKTPINLPISTSRLVHFDTMPAYDDYVEKLTKKIPTSESSPTEAYQKMTALALTTALKTMQHQLRKKSHRGSMSPPRRQLSLSNENEQSFSYEELQAPASSRKSDPLSSSWHPRSRKEARVHKTKMGSRHQRKYSSESISEDSATSMFYVDPFGNDCNDVEDLQKRGRNIEHQRQNRRNSLPPAVCRSEMHTASTAPSPTIVVEDRKGRESFGEDESVQRRRRAPRRRSVAGNPRRCKAVDADSMTDFNASMSMQN